MEKLITIEQAISALEAGKEDLTPEQLSRIESLTSGLIKGTRSIVDSTLSKTEIKHELTAEQQDKFLSVLENRFTQKPKYCRQLSKVIKGINFTEVRAALEANPALMYSLSRMEETGGSPDIIAVEDDAFIFCDCSEESPDRRDLAYEQAVKMAEEFGVDMMPIKTYQTMQKSGKFDKNTHSWLARPDDVIKEEAITGSRIDYNFFDTGVHRFMHSSGAHMHDNDTGWRGVLRVPRAA